MNKGKAKREQKELDKLLSGGRYWQWLAKVQEASLNDHYKKDWDDVWQTLAKQALRHPDRLKEFWDNCVTIKSHPDSADVRLLFDVRRFIYDDTHTEELMKIRGLSMPAEELRKRVMTWKDDSFPQKKLEKLLASFCKTPEKIVKRHFLSLAQLLPGTDLANYAQDLAQHIGYINRIGTKTDAKVKSDKLSETDNYVSDIHEGLPYDLVQILLYPFVVNLTKYLTTLARSGNTVAAANCVIKMPFLFSLLAGDKAEQIRDSIANVNSKVLDNEHIEKKISGADLPGKIVLIRKLRELIQEASYGKRNYAVYLRGLYREVMSEISRLQQTISEREKKAVANVLGREVVHDLHLLYDGSSDLSEFLFMAGQSGCMNAKLATLAIVMKETFRNRRLMEIAQDILKNQHNDLEEELEWLFRNFESLVFPDIVYLRPLIKMFGEQEGFNKTLHAIVKSKLQASLMSGTISSETSGLPDFFSYLLDIRGSDENINKLRIYLSDMKHYEPFRHLSEYLDCFPANKFSEKGFYRLFAKMYGDSGIKTVIDTFKALIEKQKDTAYYDMDIFNDPRGFLVTMQNGAFLQLIDKRWDDFKGIDTDILLRLAEIIIERFSANNILLKLYNLVETRHNDGETGLEDLRSIISSRLRKAADVKTTTPTRTRQKRRKR
ncbi:MAG: hypothetical protein HQL05_08540 [Nitrospirae bacterium]|uniref:hypothetical protein n=1 Tax=Candidatus Magnetobacterium casense TaxID=1455061 RepID=UPI00058D9793|nr:hypothetical protein [Candidatus Magnetobacterium casensis]MBF0337867.1 hypothetical protein [Nitrospirota bacterium]